MKRKFSTRGVNHSSCKKNAAPRADCPYNTALAFPWPCQQRSSLAIKLDNARPAVIIIISSNSDEFDAKRMRARARAVKRAARVLSTIKARERKKKRFPIVERACVFFFHFPAKTRARNSIMQRAVRTRGNSRLGINTGICSADRALFAASGLARCAEPDKARARFRFGKVRARWRG